MMDEALSIIASTPVIHLMPTQQRWIRVRDRLHRRIGKEHLMMKIFSSGVIVYEICKIKADCVGVAFIFFCGWERRKLVR